MINKIKSFTLKTKDFRSGKMISPCKSEWKQCDCCGQKIVQGVVMSNGDHIGNDCFELVCRAQNNARHGIDNKELFKMFGTKKAVQNYAVAAI